MLLASQSGNVSRKKNHAVIFAVVFFILASVCSVPWSWAAERKTIHAEWNYAASGPQLAGFRLYQNGKSVCETHDPAARSLDCEVAIATPPPYFYSMKAFDRHGNESAPSAIYSLGLSNSTGNTPPLAYDLQFSVNQNTPLDGALLAYDPENSPLSYRIEKYSDNEAMITLWTSTGAFTYTPDENFTGTDTFFYKVTDGQKESQTATVTITVNKANDSPAHDTKAPVLTPPPDITCNAEGLLSFVDLGEPSAWDATDGAITAFPDNSGPFRPGLHAVSWTARDRAGNMATAVQTVNVLPRVDFGPDQIVGEGGRVTVTAFLNGPAPQYPVQIPYTLTGTARAPDDHNAGAGVIEIQSGTEGSVSFDILADGNGEKDETLSLVMGEPVNAATGTKAVHTITITESNIPPLVSLQAEQNGACRQAVSTAQQLVTVTAFLHDPNPGDTVSVDWRETDPRLEPLGDTTYFDMSRSGTVSVFTFDPARLAPGTYAVRVKATDDGFPRQTVSADLVLNVSPTIPPLLSAIDSDNDGIDDKSEGAADNDGDGIPDFLDGAGEKWLLQTQQDGGHAWVIATEPGLSLRLGELALSKAKAIAVVNASELPSIPDAKGVDSQDAAGALLDSEGIFDFEVHDLPWPGQSVKVVLPLNRPLPPGARYQKFSSARGWHDFVVDDYNLVTSASGKPGICPPAGDPGYQKGLIAGNHCIQLIIEDGGPNDADHTANGAVKDPSSVVVIPENTGAPTNLSWDAASGAGASSGGGGGGGCALKDTGEPDLAQLALLLFAVLGRLYRKTDLKKQ